MAETLNEKKAEILSKLNIQTELENIGIRFTGPMNRRGWAPCLNPYKPESNASCGVMVDNSDPAAGFLTMFNMGKPKESTSFWNLIGDFMPGMNGDFGRVLQYYSEKTGVKIAKQKKKATPPTEEQVKTYINNITPEVRQYLNEKRGFTDETIAKFKIGWDPKRERNSYPVYDESGSLVNIRFHNSKKKPKTMSIAGFGQARLYNITDAVDSKKDSTVVITEGECFDPKITEVLTPDGWIYLSDYKNQQVLQVHHNGFASFTQPLAYIRKKTTKKLVTYSDNDFFSGTTLDHNLLVFDRDSGKNVKIKARHLQRMKNATIPRSTMITTGTGLKVPFCKIQLAIAIDLASRVSYNRYSHKYVATFRLEKPQLWQRLDLILENNKTDTYDERLPDGEININLVLPDWYDDYQLFDFAWIVDATVLERRKILNEIDFWYRTRYPFQNGTEYTSAFAYNASFIQTLAHTSGLTANRVVDNPMFPHLTVMHYDRQTKDVSNLERGICRTTAGIVACVQVETGAILVRQRGHISVSGNCDAIIVKQETGLFATSPTNGCLAFMPEWANYFRGKNVVICYDSDDEGRNAVKTLVLPAFKPLVMSGDIPSVKVIWLFEAFEANEKKNKDATDWFVKSGGTKQQFLDIVRSTKNYVYRSPSLFLPKPKPLTSFMEIENSNFVGQRVTVPLYIYGENSETYHAVNEIKVTYCPLLVSGKCSGRSDWDWQCSDPIAVQPGNRIHLACVGATDAQLKNSFKEYVCSKGRRPTIDLVEEKKTTIRELFAHQVFEDRIGAETGELVEKTIYSVGNNIVPIGRYQATGFIHSNPRNQKPTMLVDTMEKQDEDWQAFDLEKSRKYLQDIQAMDLVEIVSDIADNVTNIYSREYLHMGVLLTLCSPRFIDFPGEGQIRGWISSVTIGDSGCHAKGTEILMHDGTIKKVENIKVGESIMGPDSKPKIVQKLYRGSENMHKITPVKGKPFIVNENHILSLKTTPRTYQKKLGIKRTEVNILVKDYIKKGVLYKGLHKLYRSEAVEFENNADPITVDPYFLGLYIGDSSKISEHNMTPAITTADIEVLQETYEQMINYKLRPKKYRKKNNKASSYRLPNSTYNQTIKNRLGELLLNLGVSFTCDERSVPLNYKTGSLETRLQLLAGLIDSDGHLDGRVLYEFSSKSKTLAEDVVFISRSVGLAAYTNPKPVNGVDYYRVTISGHTNKIPCRIKRKRAKKRKQNKDVLVTGFSVDPVGIGDFYGFELGGDHLYVMGDFTVTHNTGKSTVAEKILNHANVGYRVSGMTSSRTGITYAIDRDEVHGWRIKAGAMLKMSRQALIVDEAQDLEEQDIKTMADAMDTGKLSVARVENRTFEAMTRCIFLCNPKMLDRQANQRTMDSFRYGCQSLLDIFPQMMLRRLDLAMFAARFDIEDKSATYGRKSKKSKNIITSKHMQALVHFAWNLPPEKIIISDAVADQIRSSASYMSDVFGRCTDLPLVCPEDFRKTLARLCTAVAVLDLSTDDDLMSITVRMEHVSFIVQGFLGPLYSASNCRLNQYSDKYAAQNVLLEDDKKILYNEFLAELLAVTDDDAKRMLYMLREVAEMDPNSQTKASQREFAEHLACDIRTIRKNMAWFVNNDLVKSSRGYKPLNKCVIFYNYILDRDQQIEDKAKRLFKRR